VKNNYKHHSNIKFDTNGTLKRLRSAKFQSGDTFPDSTLAYNNSDEIVMFSRTMHDAEIVQILIHEALHNWCMIRGNYMGCEREHACMALLGDPNEEYSKFIV
jgi:hypothetical protein